MGIYGEILHLLSNQIEFCLRVRLKRSNYRGTKFQFDWARSKNNIAENLFALASETANTCAILLMVKQTFQLNPLAFQLLVC